MCIRDSFDKAHQIDHVEKVIEESLKLATHYEVDYSMVYVIAAYHDLGLYEGREFHHITSGKVLLADETLRRWFTDEQLLPVSYTHLLVDKDVYSRTNKVFGVSVNYKF